MFNITFLFNLEGGWGRGGVVTVTLRWPFAHRMPMFHSMEHVLHQYTEQSSPRTPVPEPNNHE